MEAWKRDCRFKLEVFDKYQKEENIRTGGHLSTTLGITFAISTYIQAALILKVKGFSNRCVFALIGYTIGVNFGAYKFGDPNHHVYYTKEDPTQKGIRKEVHY